MSHRRLYGLPQGRPITIFVYYSELLVYSAIRSPGGFGNSLFSKML